VPTVTPMKSNPIEANQFNSGSSVHTGEMTDRKRDRQSQKRNKHDTAQQVS